MAVMLLIFAKLAEAGEGKTKWPTSARWRWRGGGGGRVFKLDRIWGDEIEIEFYRLAGFVWLGIGFGVVVCGILRFVRTGIGSFAMQGPEEAFGNIGYAAIGRHVFDVTKYGGVG